MIKLLFFFMPCCIILLNNSGIGKAKQNSLEYYEQKYGELSVLSVWCSNAA